MPKSSRGGRRRIRRSGFGLLPSAGLLAVALIPPLPRLGPRHRQLPFTPSLLLPSPTQALPPRLSARHYLVVVVVDGDDGDYECWHDVALDCSQSEGACLVQGQPMMRLALGLLQLQAAAGVTGSINLRCLFFSDCRLPYATMHRRRRVLVSPSLGLASLVCSSRLTSPILPRLFPPRCLHPFSSPCLSRVFPCGADPSTQLNPLSSRPALTLLLIARLHFLPTSSPHPPSLLPLTILGSAINPWLRRYHSSHTHINPLSITFRPSK